MSHVGAGPRSSRSALRWSPASRGFRLWAGVLLVLLGVYSVTYLLVIGRQLSLQPPGDAIALWTWARFVVDHPAAEIYQSAVLHSGQVALGLAPNEFYPFAYPPSFLLILWPMGLLPFSVACWTMTAISLVLYLWATVGKRWWSPTTLAAIVAPTNAITIVSGHIGFLPASLLIGGFRLADRYPVLGGALLGLLPYKPQLALLVPIALVSARMWRSIAAACITFIVLVAVTSAVFGSQIWATWLLSLPAFSNQVAAGGSSILHLMPTVRATLLQIGATSSVAWFAQGAAAIAASGIVWASFRSGPTPLAIATLLVATFLATPYAFVYDLPIVATAVLWVIIERRRKGGSFELGELLVLTIAAISPMTMPSETLRPPIILMSLILVLGMNLRSSWALQHRPRASV